jgi:leucyl-tRNA synthetase
VRLLSPFAPHLADELWRVLGYDGFVLEAEWPAFDPALTVDDVVTVVVQVNGKVRDRLEVPAGTGEEDLRARAFESAAVRKFTDGMNVIKTVVVKDKMVSIVLGAPENA